MKQPSQADHIVSLYNLSKRFKDIQAVDKLSADVFRGDVYGLLGPNGSGKSTTIRMMLSLLRPDNGDIRIFNQDLDQYRKKILKNVGAFIEKPDFYEYLSAYKNLEILSIYSGCSPDRNKIMEILELLGLHDRAQSKVKTFSKGMKQRLGIAQSLLHDPELLILDEPASGLDPAGNRDIRDLIRYLNKDRGKTIILSSHNLIEIEVVAQRVLIIDKGKKIIEGHVEEMLSGQSYLSSIKTSKAKEAAEIMKNSHFDCSPYEVKGELLYMKCTRREIPEINKFLVHNGIEIESINMEQNLEEFFLHMT
jgi:ABC-2 type transport system ATP-binding protein